MFLPDQRSIKGQKTKQITRVASEESLPVIQCRTEMTNISNFKSPAF
jgi:hypothetical protein